MVISYNSVNIGWISAISAMQPGNSFTSVQMMIYRPLKEHYGCDKIIRLFFLFYSTVYIFIISKT